jgi:tripartite-type tricarboxylate transporter receptor subunit TctC
MVVPFAAGGPTDTLARIVGERMRTTLGQPVIVENVTGAGGSIAVGRVVRAKSDGYTIGIGVWNTHVLNGAVYSLPYDTLTDLEPVGLLANNYTLIVSKKSVPATSLQELIAWMKSNNGKVSAGTAGAGASTHVARVLFQNMTDTQFQFVPYRGAAPAQKDLIGVQIDLMFDQASSALQHVRAGTIKAYAIASNTRASAAPDIPTAAEAGLPGFHISVWHAIWAPKNTPNDVVARLNGAIVEALADPAVRKRLADLGQELFPREQQTPQALGAFHWAEVQKWWPIVKAANIKAE